MDYHESLMQAMEKEMQEQKRREKEITLGLRDLQRALYVEERYAKKAGRHSLKGCFYGADKRLRSGPVYDPRESETYFAPVQKFPSKSETGWNLSSTRDGACAERNIEAVAAELEKSLVKQGYDKPVVKILEMDTWYPPKNKLIPIYKKRGHEKTLYVELYW